MAATDAKPVPVKNTAFRVYFDIRKNDGTLITTWAGQDSEVSLDGASFTDCTNEATEIGTSGVGYIDLTSSEINADSVILKTTVTNTDALPVVLFMYPAENTDIPVNATAISGDTTAADNLELQFDGTGLTGNNYPATQAALQNLDEDVEVVGGNASTAAVQAAAAVSRFGSISGQEGNQVDDWFKALAALSATAPITLSAAGFDPATDSLEAIRDRGDAAWVTGSGGASVQNIFEADPTDYDADADSFAARVLAILAKTNTIGANFTYTGSVSPAGAVDIYQGSDYHADDGTAHTWAFASTINLSGATVTLDLAGEQFAAVVSGSSGAWTISVNMTAAQTSALELGPHPYEIRAVLASGRKAPPLGEGTATVKADR